MWAKVTKITEEHKRRGGFPHISQLALTASPQGEALKPSPGGEGGPKGRMWAKTNLEESSMSKLTEGQMRANARNLRKNMTKEERHLWYDFLKVLPIMVHRQKVIGPYIVDFYIAQAKIVVELDGSQHYEKSHENYDFQRNAYLKEKGLLVLRYPNSEVNRNFRGVCEDILNHIDDVLLIAKDAP